MGGINLKLMEGPKYTSTTHIPSHHLLVSWRSTPCVMMTQILQQLQSIHNRQETRLT